MLSLFDPCDKTRLAQSDDYLSVSNRWWECLGDLFETDIVSANYVFLL